MRAVEFILEAKKNAKTSAEHMCAMTPSMVLHDMDPGYDYYRFMSIVAGDEDSEMPAHHEHFNNTPFASAYTPEEHEMLIRGLKRMGRKHKQVTKEKSSEHSSTNSTSPVPHNSGARRK
jgi:hypothetical protein